MLIKGGEITTYRRATIFKHTMGGKTKRVIYDQSRTCLELA